MKLALNIIFVCSVGFCRNSCVPKMPPYEEMLSEKGQPLRVIDGFKFRFHKRLRSGVQRWTCAKASCKAFIKFEVRELTGTVTNTHNHVADATVFLERQKFSNAVKRKATKSLCDKPLKVIREELMTQNYGDITASDLRRAQKNIYEIRSTLRPPLPKSLADLHTVLNTYGRLTTNKGEHFLLVNDPVTNIVIFSTFTNLRFLSTCSRAYVDGTFKSVPSLFLQLFTIHGYRNNNYVPLVFCLLPSKKKSTYESAFRHLVAEMIDLGLQFEPTEVYADFEEAIHLAVRQVWPTVSVKGCRFHLSQNWWRHIQACSLTNDYKEKDNEIGAFLKLFFGLPFLCPDEVEDSFVDDFVSIMPDDERVQKFTDYVFENYVSPDAKFPPSMWAAYSSSIARTTNSCESFHSHFNASFYAAHPNIYILIETLLRVQCETYAKIADIQKQKRRLDSLRKEEKIAEYIRRRDSQELSRHDFLKRVCYKFLPPPVKK